MKETLDEQSRKALVSYRLERADETMGNQGDWSLSHTVTRRFVENPLFLILFRRKYEK